MKRTILALFLFASAAASSAVHAQVAPSASGNQPTLSAGGLFTYTQPDYDPSTNTVASSSNHLFGLGGFVDYRLSRWIQLEAEGRWQHWNQTQGYTVNENTYAIGLRDPIHTFGRFTPYGKALIGFGTANFLVGHAAMFTFGGGADYRLSKRIALRADFEYQQWRVNPTLKPYTAAVGFRYRIF